MNDMIREVTAALTCQTIGEFNVRKIKHEFVLLTAELGSTYSGCEEETAQNEIFEAIEKSVKLKACRIIE